MTKDKRIIKYQFQPELATSIIYWSVTFTCFFVSLIAVLEQFKVTWFNLSFFLLFIGLSLLGLTRHFAIQGNLLNINPILKRNRFTIDLTKIDKIAVGAYGLTFYAPSVSNSPLEERVFLMLPKTKEKFIATLEEHEAFQGKVVSIKKSVGLD